MSAPLLYRLRRRMPDPWRLLGSWKLSVVLMLLAAEYYVLLAVWSRSTPGHVVQSIAGLAPFWVVYLGLLVNTAVCLWQRWPGFKRDVAAAPLEDRFARRWEAPLPEDADAAWVGRSLRRLGFRVHARAGGGLRGTRQRWAALGTYVFHLSFFGIATGFLLSMLVHQETTFRVAEGEAFTAAPDQVVSHEVAGATDLGVPRLAFLVEDIRPEYWRDELLFTELAADLVLPEGGRKTVRINAPWWYALAGFLRLTSVGYTPRFEVRDPAGRVVTGGFVKMSLFPPGQQDFFSPEALPHRIYLRLWPDWPEGVEDPEGRTLNLVAPRVEATVYRGQLLLARGLLGPGDALEFEGLRLTVPEVRYWGDFSAVVDPGVLVLFASFLFALVGLALKVRGKRAEVVWVPDVGGRGGRMRGYGAAPDPEAWS